MLSESIVRIVSEFANENVICYFGNRVTVIDASDCTVVRDTTKFPDVGASCNLVTSTVVLSPNDILKC